MTRLIVLLGLSVTVAASAATVTITVSPLVNNHTISRLSFGGNEDYGPGQATPASPAHDSIPNAPYMRLGGNRLSTYNWENNADNAGADYGPNMSDLSMLYWVGATQDLLQAPALGVTKRYDGWRAAGKEVLATIQAMGYVAADNSGLISTSPPADPPWKAVQAAKGSAFTLNPVRTDGTVYMDEYVNFLVNKYGNAASGGIKYYDLDNEPGLWNSTHSIAHPVHTTYAELSAKHLATANAILNVDPGAQIMGPAFFSYEDVRNLNGAADSGIFPANCASYYLDQMRKASTAAGHRLLHYLDVHYYPEAKGTDGNRIIYGNQANSTTMACAIARMQAPRSLWDSTYSENSYLAGNGVGPAFNYLTKLQGYVSSYYPGTKLSFSEYYFGADWDVSGGIAQADVLGVFARFDVAANYWQLDSNAYSTEAYTRAAFNLWLDYDGSGSKVGDIYADATTSDWTATSAYAARDTVQADKLWVVVLNKNYGTTQPIAVALGLTGGQTATAVIARRFDSGSAALASTATHSFAANSITDTLPARSATVYCVTLSSAFGTPTATPSVSATVTLRASFSPSPTCSRTPTPSASASPTRTTSKTTSPTATPTPSRTPTPSFSATATPSVSFVSSFTTSPTLSATASATPSATSSGTLTASSSPSAIRSATRTPSPSVSTTPSLSSSASATPKDTLTATLTLSASPSSSVTNTETPPFSATSTQTLSPVLSPTCTASQIPVNSPSQSPSASATGSASPTATATVTHTASSTASASPTNTPLTGPPSTATFSSTVTPNSAENPTADPGAPLKIEASAAVPNPNPLGVQVKLACAVDKLRLKVWTVNLVLMAEVEQGPTAAGWQNLSLPLAFQTAPNGTYYYSVEAERSGTKAPRTAPGRLIVLR